MIKIEGEGKIVSAESNKYLIDGREVISHRIRVLAEGEIWSCKSSPEQVSELKPFEGKDVNVTLGFESRKENLSVRLLKYEDTTQ